MITTSDSIKTITAALLGVQGTVRGVGKDGNNPHFKSHYATLENVCDTVRPALQSVGVVFIQSPGAIVDGNLEMTTRFIHADSGEWIEGKGDIPLGKRDPQGAGSAQTYAQRYHLMAMLGLPPVDDDGESAIDRENARPDPAGQTLSKAKSREIYAALRDELNACATLDQLAGVWISASFQTDFRKMHPDFSKMLTDHKDDLKVTLQGGPDEGGYVPPVFDKENA